MRVIACGHLHTYRRMHHRGMDIIWAPGTAMVDIERGLARWDRFRRPGYLERSLAPSGASPRLIEPERMFVIGMSGWTGRNAGTTTTLPPWSRSP